MASDFDPDAYLKGGTAVAEPPKAPAFDPDSYLKGPAEPSPIAPQTSQGSPQTSAAIQGAYQNGVGALKGPQWDNLDTEARWRAVNQANWGGKGVSTAAWPGARLGIAQSQFGFTGKEISDTQLGGLQQKAVQEAKEAKENPEKHPWNWMQDEEAKGLAKLLPAAFAALQWHKRVGSVPLINLPDAPVDKIPEIPIPGMLFTAKDVANAYNIWKPTFESLTTPESVGAMVAGGGLAKAAETIPAAQAILGRMTGFFTGLMGADTVKNAPAVRKVLQDPNATSLEKGRALAGEATSALFTVVGAVGMMHEVAPAAAKALTDKPVEEASVILHEEAAKAKTPEEKTAILGAADELQKVAAGNETPPLPEPPAEPVKVEGEKVVTESSPPEPATAESPLAGIKNAVVDEEFRKMGLDPAEHGEGLKAEDLAAEAQARLKADPLAGRKLVEDLEARPRPVDGPEVVMVLAEKNRISVERDTAEAALEEARKAGDRDRVAELENETARLRDQFIQTDRVATRIGTPQAQGLAFRRLMMGEDYSVSGMERQLSAETEGGKLTPEQTDEIRRIAKNVRETKADLEKHEARRLKAAKTRMEKATADLKERVKSGRLGPKPKPEPVKLDLEGELLKAAHERAKQEFQTAVIKERMKNRSFYERGQNTLVKWRRGFLLSSPVTLAKLTSAAAWRMATSAAEEGVGSALKKIPGVSKAAEGAPRYGGMNVQAEARAITQAFTQGMQDSWDLLKTGKSNLDVIYGHGKGKVQESDVAPRSVIEFFGSIHGALKAPVKRAEFARSFEKRVAFAIAHPGDASNPLVQTRIAMEAYKDANRSIFMQDNMLTDMYKRALSVSEDVEKGQPKYPGGKTVATLARLALPIVKVPTNIAGEVFEHATGTVTGSWRLASALRKGMENVSPEQKDLIMRNLTKGSLGSAAILLGYFNADKVGGYYQPGKRKDGDVGFGSVRVFGHDMPSYLIHNPVMEAVQIGATVRRVAESKLRKKDQEAQGLGSGIWAAAMGLTEEIPFAREAAEVGKMLGGGGEGKYAEGELAKSLLVPGGLQWLAQHTDKDASGNPVQRKPYTAGEHVKTGVPGLRETVPAKPAPKVKIPAKDAKGRPISMELPADQADKMLSSRLKALQKLRDAIPA